MVFWLFLGFRFGCFWWWFRFGSVLGCFIRFFRVFWSVRSVWFCAFLACLAGSGGGGRLVLSGSFYALKFGRFGGLPLYL